MADPFFFDKDQKVMSWLNKFPPEMHEFIKEVVLYNALCHPDKSRLLQLPFFDEASSPARADMPIKTKQETAPALQAPVTPAEKNNINSMMNL